LELFEKEQMQLHLLEDEKREKLNYLGNNFRIKVKLSELGKFDDPRVQEKVIEFRSQLMTLDKIIKLRRETLREKIYNFKQNPIIKGFLQKDRIVDPSTGEFRYLPRPTPKKKFKSRKQKYLDMEQDFYTRPPTRFKKFTSEIINPKTYPEMQKEVETSLNRGAVYSQITKDTDFERKTDKEYIYRVNDQAQLYYSNKPLVERLGRVGGPSSSDPDERRKEIRRRVFLSDEEKKARREEEKLREQTLFLDNASKVLGTGGREQEGGEIGGQSEKKVSFREPEKPRRYFDVRSNRARKPKTVLGASYFQSDDSLEEVRWRGEGSGSRKGGKSSNGVTPGSGSKRLRFSEHNQTFVYEPSKPSSSLRV
jgi:hypothetical protein